MIKSYFGILKTEMFYGEEDTLENLQELKVAIFEYIQYYNVKRIKTKLKRPNPVFYKNQVFQLNL